MIEVEVKAKIENFEDMKKKLENLGAIKSKKEFQEDIYFNSPIVDFAKSDEALRIRTTKENNNTNIFITYKGPKIDSESKTREEIEIVKKNRQYYKYKKFEISLDDVEGLSPYMEIEIALEDGTDYSIAQEKIFELFAKLGITDGFERTSYLELLEKLY